MNTRNMSICAPQISSEEGADRLFAFLKTAGDTQLEVNEPKSGLNPDTYPNPPSRKERSESADALWGQETDDGAARNHTGQFHSNAAWDGFRQGRERFLERTFDGFEPSRDQAVKELSGHLDHFSSGNHESSKPFTNEHSKLRPRVAESVFDQTKRKLG